jgi:hypothetical protein
VTFFLLLLHLAIAPAASLATLGRTMIFAGSVKEKFVRSYAEKKRHYLTRWRAQEKPDLAQEKGQSLGMDWDAINNSFHLFSKMALPYFREEKTFVRSWQSILPSRCSTQASVQCSHTSHATSGARENLYATT